MYSQQYLYEAVDNGKEVRAVFFNSSKAFDRVWHKGLLHKRRCIGCAEKYCCGSAAIFQAGDKE